MEFLMTYGWAILVVLVAIGALAYFGVLNPSRFLPSSCTIAPGIGCDEHKVTASDDSVQLLLRNGMGESLTGVTVSISGCTNSAEADGDDWVDGDVLGGTDGITLTSCSGVGAAASRFKADISVTYTSSGGLNHTKTGTVTTKVE
ncbi:MAG: hypothetical protein V1645_03015 [archaeon]